MIAPVYLCAGLRTPFGKYRGGLAAVRPDDMAAHVLRALLATLPASTHAAIDEVILGCANQSGEDNRNVARMAALLSDLPIAVPAVTVNRLCASGLEAIGQAARAIACGEAELVLAGGVESMTRAPYVMAKAREGFDREQRLEDTTLGWRLINPEMRARHGVDSMTQTAQHLATEHGIAREAQDDYAFRSQQRAEAARLSGRFAAEITPIAELLADEQPRPQGTREQLARLTPLLGEGTSITAGNASGLNDGACVLLLAGEAAVSRHNLRPMARVLGMSAAGVAPRVMGIGPVPAIARLLDRLALRLGDFDRIEVNEAFAAQVLAVARQLGLADDSDVLNRHGGAIALGHPLGASGARLALRCAREIADGESRRALISLCVGVGQGVALALATP